MTTDPALSDKLLAVHQNLAAADIAHAFGGAIAYAFCAREPRATADLDVNVFVGVARAKDVFAALPKPVQRSERLLDVAVQQGQVRLGWKDTMVDLFFSYHPFHDHAAARVRSVPFGGTDIPVLDCTDLIVFKALFDRPKDWVDIAEIVQAGTAAPGEAGRWIGELLGTESPQFRRLQEIMLNPDPEGSDSLRRAFGRPDGANGER